MKEGSAHGEDNKKRGPSREEIESLCILHAVGPHGCLVRDLATLLGLSAGIASAVAAGVEPLIRAGWVDRRDDQFSLTEPGREWLKNRLSELLDRRPKQLPPYNDSEENATTLDDVLDPLLELVCMEKE
jgi:DNA-binding MarR family transcriptional regulator